MARVVGEYRVLGELGKGGVGVVLRAVGPDGREVALKLLRATSSATLARFERERRLLLALGEEEGFVALLAAGVTAEGPYLVMPLVPGGTLRERLRAPLPVAEAVALARALAETLGRAHARGIVHRDLKPENVLFTAEGRALVADLGLGKALEDAPRASVGLSRTGELRGTPGYMAPEQVTDGKTVGPPADVFALGAILYECLVGRPAFVADTLVELLARVVDHGHEPLRRARPDAPAPLADLVERCLASDPAARPEDGAALARELARLGEGRRRWPLGVAAAAVLVVAAAALAPLLRGERPDTTTPASGEPSPVASAVAPAFPPECRELLETPRTRLTAVLRGWIDERSGPVFACALLPGDSRAVSVGDDGTVRLHDPGGAQVCLGRHDGAAFCVVVSPDGAFAASGGGAGDPTVRVWDLSRPGAGAPRAVLRGHAGAIEGLALSPDGRRLASASLDGDVRLWDPATGACVRTLANGAPARAVAFSPDGARLLTGGDGPLVLWDAGTGERLRELEPRAAVTCVAFSPDGLRALSVARTQAIRLHDLVEGGVRTLSGPEHRPWAAAFTPDGRAVLAADFDDTLRLWDAETGAERQVLRGHQAWVRTVAISRDGRRAISGAHDATLRWWDLEAGRQLAVTGGAQGWASSVSVAGERAATPSFSQAAHVWDLRRERLLATFEHPHMVSSAALSPDGRRLLTGCFDARVRLFDVDAGRLLATLEGHTGWVSGVAFTPDGATGLSCGADGKLYVWDLAGQRLRATLVGHSAHVTCVVGLDGDRAVSASLDHTLIVWDLTAGQALHVLRGHTAEVQGVAATRDGRRVVSCDAGALRLWDGATGAPVRVIARLDQPRWAVAVSADGRLALCTGRDGTSLWSLDGPDGPDDGSARPLAVVRHGATEYPLGVAFTADGRGFLTSTTRGAVLRFELR